MVRTRAQRGQPLTGNRPQGIRKNTPQKRHRLRDPDPTDTPQEQAVSDPSKVPPSPTSGLRKRKLISYRIDKYPHHSLRSARNSPPLPRPLESPAVPDLPVSPAPAPVPEEAAIGDTDERQYIIDYWRREGSWPRKYFEQDDYTRKDFDKLMDSTTKVQSLLFPCYDPVARLRFAEKDAPAYLSRKRSGSNGSTPTSMPPPSMPSPSTTMASSDWRPREEKSAP
ncbi:hypothetical protein QR685DRAFT_546897 [Neurospora intermedia]|uniref:Uncharacterized protein n=1 Tax=Neurospora intermedia TaxID=5142 RepID=A0ABR3D5N5_NEUIN